ncbi:hypothetical protein BGZ82_011336 [Podila clonocystis]|nr:hypothetical protein BGZ82_011336 [Podila clonocystis]
MASLVRHYSTLVEISIMQTLGAADVANFLVLGPKLEKLVVINYAKLGEVPCDVDAKLFIDYHKTAETHKLWKCESTLKSSGPGSQLCPSRTMRTRRATLGCSLLPHGHIVWVDWRN